MLVGTEVDAWPSERWIEMDFRNLVFYPLYRRTPERGDRRDYHQLRRFWYLMHQCQFRRSRRRLPSSSKHRLLPSSSRRREEGYLCYSPTLSGLSNLALDLPAFVPKKKNKKPHMKYETAYRALVPAISCARQSSVKRKRLKLCACSHIDNNNNENKVNQTYNWQ